MEENEADDDGIMWNESFEADMDIISMRGSVRKPAVKSQADGTGTFLKKTAITNKNIIKA